MPRDQGLEKAGGMGTLVGQVKSYIPVLKPHQKEEISVFDQDTKKTEIFSAHPKS